MKRPRRNHSTAFKARVALEALCAKASNMRRQVSPRLLMSSNLDLPALACCLGTRPRPGGQLTSVLETLRIANGGHQGARRDRTDSRNLRLARTGLCAGFCAITSDSSTAEKASNIRKPDLDQSRP